MNEFMKGYIRSFLPDDACIPCALNRKDEINRQASKTGLFFALLQSGVSQEEFRQLLGIPVEVPREDFIGGTAWHPTRCLTVTQLIEEVEKILESC